MKTNKLVKFNSQKLPELGDIQFRWIIGGAHLYITHTSQHILWKHCPLYLYILIDNKRVLFDKINFYKQNWINIIYDTSNFPSLAEQNTYILTNHYGNLLDSFTGKQKEDIQE